MKHLILTAQAVLLCLFSISQTLTLSFDGNNKNRVYKAVIDGNKIYNSGDAESTGAVGKVEKKFVITDLPTGSHSLVIYRIRPNAATASNQTEIYSNNFQLRTGYDLTIAVRGNAQVTFTEKRIRKTGNQLRTPMSTSLFSQLLTNIKSKKFQAARISYVKDVINVTGNYFTTAQVRQMLNLIYSESGKLELAKLAYLKTTDQSNFTSLFDLFNSENSKDELSDHILLNQNNTTGTVKTPMTDYAYGQLLTSINNNNLQSSKFNLIKNSLNSNYFLSSQLKQLLTTIYAESDRLYLAKLGWPRVTDPTNFSSLNELFNLQSSKDELAVLTGNTTTTTKTAMESYAFSQLLQQVYNNSLQSGKFNLIKNALNTNYVTSAQLKQLLNPILAEPDRLYLAKQAWPRITDPANYNTIYDLFFIQSSKDQLATLSGQYTTTTTSKVAMADATFSQLLASANNHFMQSGKVGAVQEAFNNTSYYFSTSQIRQLLTIVTSETDRLELARLSWARVTDPTNFTTLSSMFSTQLNKDEIYRIAGATTTTTTSPYASRVPMSDGSFNLLMLKANLHFSQTKLITYIREKLNEANYYSIAQIKTLLTQVNSEAERLELAKLAYLKVSDPTDYTTQLSDLFPTQASRDALNNYVNLNRF